MYRLANPARRLLLVQRLPAQPRVSPRFPLLTPRMSPSSSSFSTSPYVSSLFETTRASLHPSSTLALRSFASSSRSSSKTSLSQLEHAANSHPHDPSYQASYLHQLSSVDPLATVRRVESGRFATSSDVLLEYERAKNRLDAQHSSSSSPFNYSSSPSSAQPQFGQAYYASSPSHPPSAYAASPYASYPPPSYYPPLGSTSHPISVSIIKEPVEPPPRPKFASRVFSLLTSLFPLVLIGTLLYVSISPGATGGSIMGRGGVKEFKADGDVPKVQFSDVKGCDEAKAELEEIVAYLRNPSHFEKLGGKMVKGILLTGPPGTGKTLLAKAIAGEAHVPFFSCSGSDFEEMFVGVGARRIRDLFTAARRKSPCIIFIDEIDAVGSKRSGRDLQAARLSLNQLLVEMDGFEKSTGVIVIGATNLPSLLDAALTRPGRFDRHVVVPVPDLKGRRAILDLYAKKVPMADDVNIDIIARGTPGCTGAQLFNLINSAALRASSKGMASVTMHELEHARDKILMGAERSMVMTEEDRKNTAYHEGGHALVALYTKHSMPLHKATILPRGQALGVTHFLPEDDMVSQTKAQLLALLDVAMGGRVAEEIIFGTENVTTGAASDLQNATSIARRMVTLYGMSDKAGLAVEESGAVSSAKKKRIDAEVDLLLKEAYARATAIVTTHTRHLHSIANALLQHETLTAKEMRELLTDEGLIGEEEVKQLEEVEKMDEEEMKGKRDLIAHTDTTGGGGGGRGGKRKEEGDGGGKEKDEDVQVVLV